MKTNYLLVLAAMATSAVFSQSTSVPQNSSFTCQVLTTANSSGNKCFGDCNGSITTFPMGTAPYLYTWSTGATSPNLTGLCAATYSVTVTESGGSTCTGSTAITAPANLIVTVASSSGNTATASASGGSPAYTYSWLPGGQNTATATGLSNGIYTVTVTDKNGCIATSTTTVTATEIGQGFTYNAINLYPNPAIDFLNIEVFIENSCKVKIMLTNILGEAVYEENVIIDKVLKQAIPISNFSKGIYFLAVQQTNERILKKIVLQ